MRWCRPLRLPLSAWLGNPPPVRREFPTGPAGANRQRGRTCTRPAPETVLPPAPRAQTNGHVTRLGVRFAEIGLGPGDVPHGRLIPLVYHALPIALEGGGLEPRLGPEAAQDRMHRDAGPIGDRLERGGCRPSPRNTEWPPR